METAETRSKLAEGIRTLQAKGDSSSVEKLVSAYKTKYQPIKQQPYNVPKITEPRSSIIDRANTESTQYAKEAKYANSPLGLASNFGKALVTNIMPHEVGLGESLGKIYGNQSNEYSQISQNLSQNQLDLVKKIKEYDAQGLDSTKLKQIYNSLDEQKRGVTSNLEREADLPTQNKVIGQLGGTAFDILTAGLGQNKTGMVSGKLFKPVPIIGTAANVAGQPQLGSVAAQKASGLFTKKGAGNVLKGAGLGYVSDVSSGLAGIRGKDREDEGAFVPGLGTAIGTTIPAISEITQSFKNRFNPDTKMKNLQAKIDKDVDSLLGSTKADITKTSFYANKKNTDIAANIKDPYIFRGLKVKEGKIDPTEAIASIDDRLDNVLSSKQKLLPEVDRISLPIDKQTIRNKAVAALKGTVTAADEKDIVRAIDQQLAPYPDKMKPSEVDQLRALFRRSARDARGLLKRGNEYSALETASRNAVFDVTDDLPFDNTSTYKQLNDYARSMIDTKEFLEKNLRGRAVKGGRLGEYTGRIIGGMAGSKLGPLGTIAGSEIGGTISSIITNSQLGNSQKLKLIQNMTDDPKILSQIDDLLKQAQDFNYPQLPVTPNRIIAEDPRLYNPDGSIKTPSSNTMYNDFQQNSQILDNTKQLPPAKPGFINPIEAVDPRQFEPSGNLKTSPAQSIPALKNPLSVNPKSGRFQKSFSSSLPDNVTDSKRGNAFATIISRELQTPEKILSSESPETIAQLGGMPRILEATKKSIITNITSKDINFPEEAAKIQKIDTSKMKNIDDLKNAIEDLIFRNKDELADYKRLKSTRPLTDILNPKSGVKNNYTAHDKGKSGKVPFIQKLKDIPNQEGGFIKNVFRGDDVKSDRFKGNYIKGKTEFGDAPFVSFSDNRKLAENFGNTVGEYKLDTDKILDYSKSKDKEALKIVGNSIDLTKDQVSKLKKLGYEAISFPNIEDPEGAGRFGGKEIRYFGNYNTKKYDKLPINLKKKK